MTAVVVTVVTLAGCLGRPAPVAAASLPKELAPLEFLIGTWDGVQGRPGREAAARRSRRASRIGSSSGRTTP
jgi:hypothetical protein